MSVFNQEQIDNKPSGSGGNYLNKFEEGDTKIRILAPAVVGWEYWKEEDGQRKPIRLKEMPEEVPAEAAQDKYGNYIKYFMAFVIWNYAENKVQIMQIPQATIQDALIDLDMNQDWGDLRNYDVTVKKDESGDRVKYSVTPLPPSDIPLEAAESLESNPVNLQALYDSGDPFNSEGVNLDQVDENLKKNN